MKIVGGRKPVVAEAEAPQEVRDAYDAFLSIRNTLLQQLDALQKLDPKGWEKLQELEEMHDEAAKQLSDTCERERAEIGKVKLKPNFAKGYDIDKFLRLAKKKKILPELKKMGVIRTIVDQKAADEYLKRYPEDFEDFKKEAWVEEFKFYAVYGIPKVKR